MNLSLKQQVYCIFNAFRHTKRSALYVKDLNAIEGQDADSSTFQEGINFLKNDAIFIEGAPEEPKIVLRDFAMLRSLYLGLPDDNNQSD